MVDLRVKTTLIALCLAAHGTAAQDAAVRLILWTGSDCRWGPGLSRAIHTELSRLAVPGFRGVDLDTEIEPPPITSSFVSVRLMGDCDTQSGRLPSNPERLGYVTQIQGMITRNMSVDCDAILSAIKPHLRDMPETRRNFLFARALVRVIQHELRHILEQRADHLAKGVFKAQLNPTDLIVPNLRSR